MLVDEAHSLAQLKLRPPAMDRLQFTQRAEGMVRPAGGGGGGSSWQGAAGVIFCCCKLLETCFATGFWTPRRCRRPWKC